VVNDVLLKDILKKRNEMELTAEELTRLKQDIRDLKDAADVYCTCEFSRNKLIDIKGR